MNVVSFSISVHVTIEEGASIIQVKRMIGLLPGGTVTYLKRSNDRPYRFNVGIEEVGSLAMDLTIGDIEAFKK
ncbi:MAG: hypothetical protein ACLUPK_03285 [Veillonella sp.]